MPRKRKLDAETIRMWDRLGQPEFAYPDYRKSLIISAYCYYRAEFGSILVSNPLLRTYLTKLIKDKGTAQGYAVAMNLRDALRAFWGNDAAAQVTRLVRDIKPRFSAKPKSEWDRARTPMTRLPLNWQKLFIEHLEGSKSGTLPLIEQLSASTLKGWAEGMCRWHTFREGDSITPLTGSELQLFATSLLKQGMSPLGVQTAAEKVYYSYRNIVAPGFSSETCLYVIQDLKGMPAATGSSKKTADQIVSARLIYETGFHLMKEALSNPRSDSSSAVAYRDGLLLAIAAALPLRRRALASLDTTFSFRLDDQFTIQIDISGNFLKLRQHRKIIERFRATLVNPKIWRALDIWVRTIRPVFDDGASLFPSLLVRGEALTPNALAQVFGDITQENFKVRVPIHRVRDCVATECVEEMEHGAAWAPHLLNHKSADTTNQYYIHATGVKAAKEFGRLLQQKRSDPTELLI